MRVTLPIANGFYVSDSLPISAQRAVNWRPSVPQTSTVTDANLFPTEGIQSVVDGSVLDNCRGAHVFAGTPFFVIGSSLYRLNRVISSGVYSYNYEDVGFIAGQERVYMADNGTQLCITAAPDLITLGASYIFTQSPDSLAEIIDVNFDGPASSVVYASGYFVFHKADGKKFFNSPLNNGLTGYDALDFNVASADPDQIRGLGVLNNQLYVFGLKTVQLFRDIGRAPSPFSPISGAVLDVGVSAPKTIINFGGGIAFVGSGSNETPSVWIISGGRKQKISTLAIDNELSKINIEDNDDSIFSWAYSESGAFMLGISLPDTCYVYDIANQRWHERQSIDGEQLSRYRVSHILDAYGLSIVGDLQSGSIGELREDVYTEYGVMTPRFITTRPFDNTGNSTSVVSIEAVVDAGQGLANDARVQSGTTALGFPIYGVGGSDPKMALSWSDDGGRTYKGYIEKSIGALGEYNKRPIWPRLGSFPRQRVLKFECSSPTKVVFIKAEADLA